MGKGRLIYLMGASGSGKDTLIAQLKNHLSEAVYVPRRYITRPVNETQLEQHVYMPLEAFTAAKHEGLFAFHWQANGYQYAICQEIHTALDAGKMVLINGSREHFQALDDAWKNVCVPVYLAVSAEVQTARLLGRGRENLAQIEARVARSVAMLQHLPDECVVLDANQSVPAVYQQFMEHMQQLALLETAA
ncbi:MULTISPECIES: hypothetical protein [Vitreoscilla]|uniref:Phosphonate metabolism protein/1,5-bisphosphokinase (PRPP-forming) PhnN n=1 Tax=Vitreoscilla stercoraria TaxID=61 RepID=A0ABY4E7X7_VITST|nr:MULTISPECIES: hypothetical protein [Vitreoscilla]AUZ04827.1 putative ribose 1,5-bisphosphate phosphokinase PhnN [Vitreoscilla sp. C1]UOO91505.1 phosphonate metabolism protein/1,5-bisphosphokinase (PRPP-forming) PhnN [Vitreoscilla stercoraria]